jgi:hypothetical protein
VLYARVRHCLTPPVPITYFPPHSFTALPQGRSRTSSPT